MSQKLGLVALGRKEELVFLGREISEQRNYSDEIAYEIDKEVRALVDEAYDKAKEILTMYKDKLIEISELLIEKETLDAVDFEALFDGMPRPEPKLTQVGKPDKPEAKPATEQPRVVPGLQGAPGMAFTQEPESDLK
jgi:cell division protease FtsH